MTNNDEKNKTKTKDLGAGLSSFHLEAQRGLNGMRVNAGGIIGVCDFNSAMIQLQSHGGRIIIGGENLTLSVLEGRNVEIIGRVEEISFRYGKT